MKKLSTIYTLISICCLTIHTITTQTFTPKPIWFQTYEWAKSMGDTLVDGGKAIAVDASGNVYTTGFFEGTVDFDPDDIEVHNLTSDGSYDVFISKLDSEGNFIWAKRMGGMLADAGHSIALDVSGNVYTTGYFTGIADFDPDEVGVFNLPSTGDEDIFISKLDTSGNFIWAKNMGGILDDHGNSITVDASGNVYMTGFFQDTADFDPDPVGIRNLFSAGSKDIFICKLDTSGNLEGAGKMGGLDGDIGKSIAIDDSGNIYTTGSFEGTADFNPKAGVDNLDSNGGTDIFISKLDASGDFVGAGKIGGLGSDRGNSIALDTSGNIYITGSFEGTVDFDPKAGIYYLTSITDVYYVDTADIFISKLDTSGNFVWAKSIGGIGKDAGFSITLDASENVYTTGYFSEIVDFDPDGVETFDLPSEGLYDVFISKLDSLGTLKWAKSMGGSGNDNGFGIAVDASFNVYTTGYFNETVDFDPGTGIDILSSLGFSDIFVHMLSNDLLDIFHQNIISPTVVYPNPTTENVTLDLGQQYNNVTLRVKFFSGELISTSDHKETDKLDFSIEGKAGVYLVEVFVDNEKIRTLKVIKQ